MRWEDIAFYVTLKVFLLGNLFFWILVSDSNTFRVTNVFSSLVGIISLVLVLWNLKIQLRNLKGSGKE